MRFFFGIMMYAYLGASVFVVLHLMDVLRPFKIRWVLMVLYILTTFSLMLGRNSWGAIPLELSAFITRLGYSWISILTFTFVWSFVWCVLRLFKIGPVSPQSRFLFFSGEIMLCLIIFIIGNSTASTIKITRHQIEVPSKEFGEPLRIVQISDSHIGFMNGKRKVKKVARKINELNPDIVVITGDFLENENSYAEIKDLGAPLRELNLRYGVWLVLGNHEYIAGINKSIDYINSLGINILRDESVVIDDRILLIGRDDVAKFRRTGVYPLRLDSILDVVPINDSLATAREHIGEKLTILLTHQVHSHKEYENRGFDLVLSGHTHAGQFIPWSWIVKKQYDIAYGLVKRGESHFYVSSGTGYWGPPFRLGTRSEMVLFEVRGERY